MKRLFEKNKRLAQEKLGANEKLLQKIEEYLGFEFPAYELDSLVDTINEGYGNMSYEEFIKELDRVKIKLKKQEKEK